MSKFVVSHPVNHGFRVLSGRGSYTKAKAAFEAAKNRRSMTFNARPVIQPEHESHQVKTAKIHPWIYVIIPVDSKVVFAAFCKGCRNYFTEEISVEYRGKGRMIPSTLPRYGCEPISEDIDLLG